jgi:predicted TIM-barrel fold metal-dependent hydrolase
MLVLKKNVSGYSCPIYAPNEYILLIAKQYPKKVIPFGSVKMNDLEDSIRIKQLHTTGIVGIKYHALEGYSFFNSLLSKILIISAISRKLCMIY